MIEAKVEEKEDTAELGLLNNRPNHPMNLIIQTVSQKLSEPSKELLPELKAIAPLPSQVEPATEVPHTDFVGGEKRWMVKSYDLTKQIL